MMFRYWPNLVVIGVVALLLCSTPVFHGTSMQTGMLSRDHMAHGHTAEHTAMPMAFEYGFKATLWFKSLKTETPASYCAVLVGLGLLAFLHEGISAYRRTRVTASPSPDDMAIRMPNDSKAVNAAAHSSERLVHTGLHMLSLTLSYLLMLAVMSMNAGVFVAVLLGFGAGFYVFHGERILPPPVLRVDVCHGS